MTIPVAQVPSITLEPSKENTQVSKIKGNFDQKVFTIFEKSGDNFSNPAKLGELAEKVTGEKIHWLTKSQMRLRKQEYYVATPKFGLRFSLPEPLRILSKKGKEITSSNYTSIEKTKESKEVEEGPDIDDTYDDVQKAPLQLEDGVQSTIDNLKELNLGTLEDPRPIFISALLTPEEVKNTSSY
ncbi:hypothetical protein MTR67_044721 [Solanum verrucosum]|uniref:Uncharacterized protein n=1 Tax=Solanum verrucosum TaxID=315347 RepID=A0AAF0UTX7_SOLVR|nr:hypothetical protein MTR67_044721 [Solanum verrucosum]